MVAVHKFKSTEDAYDESQYRDDIKSGDVLVAGFTVGVLVDAWPVAVKGYPGAFHQLEEGVELATLDGGKWAESARVAEAVDVTKAEIKVWDKTEVYTKKEASEAYKELKAFFDERASRNHYSSMDDKPTQKINREKLERLLSLERLLNITEEDPNEEPEVKNKSRLRP